MEEQTAKREARVLKLYLDSCLQCIRFRQVVNADGSHVGQCLANLFAPRQFTDDEEQAMREGTIRLPEWCPLPVEEVA